jgi:hypothetical protein
MSTTIRVVPDAVRTDPHIEGLDVSDDEWRLDVDRYREFLVDVTGISAVDGLTGTDCYRIGNRLQAQIETHKRQDEWTPDLVDSYPDISFLEAFLWIARFFRACHDCYETDEHCSVGHVEQRDTAPHTDDV